VTADKVTAPLVSEFNEEGFLNLYARNRALGEMDRRSGTA
jgi:hypothetical protein